MQKKLEGLDLLQKRVSVSLNKSPEDLEPFFAILKSNWYQSEEDLLKLSIEDYQRMKIPHRVALSITQQLKPKNPVSKQKQKSQNDAPQKPILNQEKMKQIVKQYKIKMENKLKGNIEQRKAVTSVIYKIIGNIVKDPYEMKFRVLKKTNNMIQRNIIQHEPSLELMKAIGFVDCGQTLQMTNFQVPHLIFMEQCLSIELENLDKRAPTNTVNFQQPEKEQNRFLDVKKFPQSQASVKQQFSEEKLSEMKYADALEKLLEIRNKIMSQPLLDRRMRFYDKKLESKTLNVTQICFEQQFAKSNDADIVGYWKQILSNNAKSQKFQSKRKLQFEYLIKQQIYRETLIKIKLPNELIIEAYFGPMEKLEEVLAFVRTIITGDIYLFTAPPKKVMDKKQLEKTLVELDSVPQGSFYLSAISNFYIKNQFASMIER